MREVLQWLLLQDSQKACVRDSRTDRSKLVQDLNRTGTYSRGFMGESPLLRDKMILGPVWVRDGPSVNPLPGYL